jgi:G3E family GTPase
VFSTRSTEPPCAYLVTFCTGFLGSGKTTLINSILSGNHGKKIAIIENEVRIDRVR